MRGYWGRLPIAILAPALALMFLTVSFVLGPAAYAQEFPPRDTRPWDDPDGGPSFTFSSMEIRDDCTSRGDRIYTSGMREGWRLSGTVTVRRPDDTFTYAVIPVNQTGDLDLLVPYPPVSQWQDNGSNHEIHVDMAIQVLDANNQLVTWVGGDQDNAPGVLGPGGQDWDVYCTTPLTPAISIVKLTNGADANDPDAAGVPVIAPGDPVTWTYRITNTGPVDIPLAEITVTDNIPGVSPLFAAVESGDLKGDGNAILQPGEVWRYTATGAAVDLSNPPQNQGLVLVANVCREGNASLPGRTAYTNIGTVQIPNMSATDPSSYCNPEVSIAVSKTANTSFTRRYTWQIGKVVSPSQIDLVDGQSTVATYTVTLTRSNPIDENFRVFGTITVNNPHPASSLQLTGITDRLGNGQNATVNCPSTTVPAGGKLVCSYETALPNNADGTNTATVTTTTGIAYNSPVVSYSFVGVLPSETTLNSVTVTDTNPATGQPWTFSSSGSQSYQLPFACTDIDYDENGAYQRTVNNTVVITQTGQQSSAVVNQTCRLPQATITGACVEGVPTWTVMADTTGAYVVQFGGNDDAQSTVNLNLVANVPATFTRSGADLSILSGVRLLFNGNTIATDIGALGPGCVPTSLPPTDEPNKPAPGNYLYLPVVTRR